LEPLVKRLMVKYLGEMEEEDLIMFVLEHLKDHKPPQKLIEGLEPVRLFVTFKIDFILTLSLQVLEEEATELVVNVWRQIIFESMAYNEGLLTDKMLVD
jgi:RNA-binding protein 25